MSDTVLFLIATVLLCVVATIFRLWLETICKDDFQMNDGE